MNITTGQTVYELVRSFNPNNNNPIVPTTFDTRMYIDGVYSSGFTFDVSLSDNTEGLYSFSWSANTYGVHQFYVKNDSSNVIYVSELYHVKSDSEINPSPTIYVGL
jgi:hypothetical protein